MGHQGSGTPSPSALTLGTQSDARDGIPASCPALARPHTRAELRAWGQRCPSPLPAPHVHHGWNQARPSSHTEEGAASAHGHGKHQQEQGRWEENGSCAALPSSILLVSSGSQTPAQIPGLPHHPAEILDATHRTSTKPHLAPSCPCLLSSTHTRRLRMPDPAPAPQPPPLPQTLRASGPTRT